MWHKTKVTCYLYPQSLFQFQIQRIWSLFTVSRIIFYLIIWRFASRCFFFSQHRVFEYSILSQQRANLRFAFSAFFLRFQSEISTLNHTTRREVTKCKFYSSSKHSDHHQKSSQHNKISCVAILLWWYLSRRHLHTSPKFDLSRIYLDFIQISKKKLDWTFMTSQSWPSKLAGLSFFFSRSKTRIHKLLRRRFFFHIIFNRIYLGSLLSGWWY